MLRSLKSRLIALIFMYLFITIIIVTGAIYKFYSGELKSQSEMYFIEKVDNTAIQLDNLVDQMAIVSSQLLSSHTLQGMMFEANQDTYNQKNFFEQNIEQKRIAQDILWSYNSPSSLVDNVNIYGASSYIGLRYTPSVETILDVSSKHKWQLEDEERFAMALKHIDSFNPREEVAVISLLRPFIASGYGFMDVGTIEVQKKYSDIETICHSNDLNGFSLLVVNHKGEVVFAPKVLDEDIYNKALSATYSHNEKNLYAISISGISYHMAYADLEETTWRVILIQPTVIFTEPLRKVLIQLILSIVSITGFVFLLVLLIVSRVTKPLKVLVENIDQFGFDNELKLQPYKVREIETLQSAFVRLVGRLRDSAGQLVIAKETELKLRIATMQAQINPHFLYNALTAISSVAQEENSEKVPIMCHQLSEVFRYASVSDDKPSTLEAELENIKNYIEFNQWRYEHTLTFRISQSGQMGQIILPRLVLQPFVENCFAHGFKQVYPPYNITILCESVADGWTFYITDNGSGFEGRALYDLEHEMKVIDDVFDQRNNYNELKAKGKAILNIYIRLKLLYKDSLVFRIGNNTNGVGAFVEIKVGKKREVGESND